MANNVQAETVVSAGTRFLTAEVTGYGDANTHVPGCFLAIVSGSEGSQTFAEVVGGAGAVSAGVQRMTLASDDPAVVALQILDNAIAGNEMQVDIVSSATLTVTGTGGTFPVTDSGGSLTVDAPVGTPVFVRLSDGSAAITTLPVSLASVPSHAVTNAGTFAVQAAQSGTWTVDLGATDNAVLDAIAASLAGTLTVGSHAVTNAGTFAVQAAQSGTWNITNISGTVSLPTGASTAAKQPALGTAGTASADVITVQGIASMTPLLVTAQASTNTQEVVGDAAHGAAVAGNPLLIGLEGRSSDGTAVDSGDVVRALASLLGKQVTLPYALPGATWQYAAVSGGITDTADDVAKTAAGAGLRNYVTHLSVVNGHATVSTEVVVKSASTVIWRGFAQAAGGGVAEKFDPPLRGGDNEAINVTNITTGSATYFNLQGYVASE